MHDHELAPIITDPDLHTTAAAYALLALADSFSGRDPDVAGDIVLLLTERLQPGGMLRERLSRHANPAALLNLAAKNAADHSRKRAGRQKRQLPLAPDGDLVAIEQAPMPFTPTLGLFDVLEDHGWTMSQIEILAIPRQRAGRSIHPGIEDALDHLATCYGITTRCPGCPTEMDLLRIDLRGPESWPALVPVLHDWGWSTDLIQHITTSPANIAHWRAVPTPPPARQERRMVTIARQMRYEPWLLQDSALIRDRALPSHRRTLTPPAPPTAPADTCPARTPTTAPSQVAFARGEARAATG
jgi:hypothetical protein